MKVVKKLILLIRLEIPAMCSERIAQSTLHPTAVELRGAYTVQPTPGPILTRTLLTISMNDGISKTTLNRFNRGNTRSVVFITTGITQFPNPPIPIGIAKKKIIIIA